MDRTPDLLTRALGLPDGLTPFPWQLALVERFQKGDIPDAIDVPTGLGKTGIMAAWLVARALGTNGVPRRLVYVVDRRAVVDQATREAERLRDFVEGAPDVKKNLGLDGLKLPVSTLRGQFTDNREWMKDPTLPAIVVGTIDMIGSRFLFEGYGVSRKIRPFHAGLLGADALYVLDEAHLVPPFTKLMQTIAMSHDKFGAKNEHADVVPRLHVVAMSATSSDGHPAENVLRLSPEDEAHEEAKRRLDARKTVEIVELGDADLPKTLSTKAWQLGEETGASRILIYCDSREHAEQIYSDLKKRRNGKPDFFQLLVGSRRVHEREAVRGWLERHGFIPLRTGQPAVESTETVFLVATSAGEVGVDLDAQHMVCDAVAWERMVQRLGRVNRFGRGDARVFVIAGGRLGKKKRAGTDGTDAETDETKRQKSVISLLRHLKGTDGKMNASPRALQDLLGSGGSTVVKLVRDATTPPPLRPPLNRPLVDAWSMTSIEEHTGRPEIQPWLRGWVTEGPQTRIVWRKVLPVQMKSDGIFEALSKRDVDEFFEAASPHLAEVLEAETWKVAEWIHKRAKARWKDDPILDDAARARPLIDDVVGFLLTRANEMERPVTALELQQERKGLERLLAGKTIVLDARFSGLSEVGLLDDNVSTPPLTIEDDAWPSPPFIIRIAEADEPPTRASTLIEELRLGVAWDEEGRPQRYLIVDAPRNEPTTEDARSAGPSQALKEHSEWAEEKAARIARALGLPQELEGALKIAARHHDDGKDAATWQDAFRAPLEGRPYAKTNTKSIDQKRLGGYRHEFGSLLKAEQASDVRSLRPELRDLVLHLIAAHHGYARPLMPSHGVEEHKPSDLQGKVAEIALRFARLQKDWGVWGLAWWESLLRAADHQASAMNDERREGT